ncbi:MAG: FAD-dependent oxidoreductase [Allosphingosinicella sp.]
MSRRGLLVGGAAAAAVASAPKRVRAQTARSRWDVVVVGAGVFGAWTAMRLLDAGKSVLLIDAWGPAHARASSGGESRLTRGSYGADEVYTRMALESLPEWRALSAVAGLPIFHPCGILFFFPQAEPFLEETMQAHGRLGLPTQLLDQAAMRRRFPQIDFAGIEVGLLEPDFGALMARRAVQTLVERFVRAGGDFQRAAVRPPPSGDTLEHITASDGRRFAADRFVFACGPWLGRVFPKLLGSRIFPTRQEVFFFAPEPGDSRFAPEQLPGWADFNNGDIYYGFPDLEGRGFKIAHDAHGPAFDPDVGDRTPSPAELADVRDYMERRFPGLRGRPLSEARVCQYENSSNGDLLIDLHPAWNNVALVGAGSGHGFKHGPAVGRYAADLLLGTLERREPRFSLATKQEAQARAVH